MHGTFKQYALAWQALDKLLCRRYNTTKPKGEILKGDGCSCSCVKPACVAAPMMFISSGAVSLHTNICDCLYCMG